METIKTWYRNLPDKKVYVELITAILTIPVLITVFLTNVNNLKKTNQPNNYQEKVLSANSPQVLSITPEEKINPSTSQLAQTKETVTPTKEECKKLVGPVEIIFPKENEIVIKNPLCLDISYRKEEYCPVVWSYRINGASWSDYTDKSICLYNLEAGEKQLELRVKSIVSEDETVLRRNFIYQSNIVTPSVTQPATDSAN